MDAPGAEEHLKEFCAAISAAVYPISAELEEGLEPVLDHLEAHFFKQGESSSL